MSVPPQRVVRVFVSSTWSDMDAERKVLETVVFPELRHRCTDRGIELVKIDPRFNAASEPEDETALAERFRQIEVCRPFFLGILGECYGRFVAVPDGLAARHRWLAACKDRSITEWEILHGVLNDVGAAGHSFFYFRDPHFMADLPPALRPRFQPESAAAAGQLAALKYRIRASGRPVTENYPCRWDPAAEQPAGLDAFARQVIDHLWAAIEEEYLTSMSRPPLPPSPSQVTPPENAFSLQLPDHLELAPLSDEIHGGPSQPYLDGNVQFTVYRPKTIEPRKWYPMLAFAHLDDLPADADEDEPHPVEEVKRQAEAILGKKAREYRESTEDSRLAVPREGEISLVPRVPGLEFNPPRRTFLWQENVHREEFKLRAGTELDGQTAKGALTIFLGSIILAEVGLSIRVQGGAATRKDDAPAQKSSARPYRKIFASYSHKDLAVVEQFERYGKALGDTYLRDWVHLRAGEEWGDRLMQMIDEADVFQLFWSTNAMRSEFVEREWRHALRLNRPNFVRPTYWEEPLPRWPERGLPPDELARFHFERLPQDLLPLPASPAVRKETDTDELDLGGELMEASGSAAGINPKSPADSGTSLESSEESGEQVESDSGFELTLDDSRGLVPLEEEQPKAAAGEKDIFDTDVEVPAMGSESGSEAVAIEDADADLESSDFDMVVHEEEAPAARPLRRRAMPLEEECEEMIAAEDDEVMEAPMRRRPHRRAVRRRGASWGRWAALLLIALGLAVAVWWLFLRN